MSASSKKYGSDFAKIDAHVITPEEYEEIPELTDEFLDRATYAIDGKPVSKEEGVAAMASAARGRPKSAHPKEHINIRLSPDVLEAFRVTGPGWQTRIDDALRQWLKQRR